MIYKIITKVWKYSLKSGYIGLSSPLTRIINSYWCKNYYLLAHTFETYSRNQVLIFIFDFTTTQRLTRQLLGSVFYTILLHPYIPKFKGNMSIVLRVHYVGDDGELEMRANSYIFTSSTTPEDFTKHFLHFTNPDVYYGVFILEAQVINLSINSITPIENVGFSISSCIRKLSLKFWVGFFNS
jgi:hypothetical protein